MLARITLSLALALPASLALAATELISRSGDIGLYANARRAVNERAVYEAKANETFIEIRRQGDMVQVRTRTGQELWVEARLVTRFEPRTGTAMDLGEGQIEGFLDNPTAVYILTEGNMALGNISLQRNFLEAVQGNMDRETVEHRNGEVR